MSKYVLEARSLAKLLNAKGYLELLTLVKRFATVSPIQRKQLVLHYYFKLKDKSVTFATLRKEAEALHEIFPNYSMQDILVLLQDLDSEENRVKIVAKKLLRKDYDRSLKRASDGIMENAIVEKKPKMAATVSSANDDAATADDMTMTETNNNLEYIVPLGDVLINTIKSEPNPSSLDSESTIISSFKSNQNNSQSNTQNSIDSNDGLYREDLVLAINQQSQEVISSNDAMVPEVKCEPIEIITNNNENEPITLLPTLKKESMPECSSHLNLSGELQFKSVLTVKSFGSKPLQLENDDETSAITQCKIKAETVFPTADNNSNDEYNLFGNLNKLNQNDDDRKIRDEPILTSNNNPNDLHGPNQNDDHEKNKAETVFNTTDDEINLFKNNINNHTIEWPLAGTFPEISDDVQHGPAKWDISRFRNPHRELLSFEELAAKLASAQKAMQRSIERRSPSPVRSLSPTGAVFNFGMDSDSSNSSEALDWRLARMTDTIITRIENIDIPTLQDSKSTGVKKRKNVNCVQDHNQLHFRNSQHVSTTNKTVANKADGKALHVVNGNQLPERFQIVLPPKNDGCSSSGISSTQPTLGNLNQPQNDGLKIKIQAVPLDLSGQLFGDGEIPMQTMNEDKEAGTSTWITQELPKKEKKQSGGYNLYKHLNEIFSDIPKSRIKKICKRYPIDKHVRPPDNIFNIIVSDLLTVLPVNVERNNKSDAINATIDAVVANYSINHQSEDKQSERSTLRAVPSTSAPVRNTAPSATATSADVIMVPDTVQEENHATDNVQVHDITASQDALNTVLTDLAKRNEVALPWDMEDVDEFLDEEMEREDEATADNTLVYPLMEMFPQASPKFIRKICRGKVNEPGVLNSLITEILEQEDYPKRQKAPSPEHKMDAEEQLAMLKEIFPDADPSFLQVQCDRLIDKPCELKIFISNLLETRRYPTMRDYLRKQKISAQQKQYTTDFKVENFLEIIPNPVAYFEDPKRKGAIVDDESVHYAICFLRNQFCRISLRAIREIVKKHEHNFLAAYKELQKVNPMTYLKSKRGECVMPQVIQNIPLLQEIAFIEHRNEIEDYLKLKKIQEAKEKLEAKQAGLLQTCKCCFDDEVMPRDIYKCESGCLFCKDCVRRGAEVAFGDGKLDFVCLSNCGSHFSLQTLQAVLNPKMFSKVALKKQVEEVKAAGIEDLETCPFCDFVTIPAREDKLFRCLNPECMKESCRLCKEPSHLPLRCEEVEKEDDVKIRTYIENKMTEALLRKCYKCGMKFIKADGCNKMTCSCGALMCYVCNQPVKDYKHFNGPGGDRFDLCPLYSDTNNLHEEAVLKGAEAAKKEIGVDKNPSKLKIDPTADVTQHYNEIKKKNPVMVPPYENPALGGPHVINLQDIPNPMIFNQRAERLIHRMHEHFQRQRQGGAHRRRRPPMFPPIPYLGPFHQFH